MTTYQVKCPCGTVLSVMPEMANEPFVCPHCARKLAFTPPRSKLNVARAPAPVEEKSSRWFLARNKQRLGPYSSAQLKQLADAGNIIPDDMILKEGRQKWVNAGSVKGLFTAKPPSASPPELPVAEAMTTPDTAPDPFGALSFPTRPGTAYARRPRQGKGVLLIGGGVGLAVLAVTIVLVIILNRSDGKRTVEAGNGGNPNGDNKEEVAAKKQLDLSYIAADFNAAVVIHPGRILERPFVAKLLEDKSIAGALDPIGFDPRILEQLIVVVDPFPGGNVAAMHGWIARSTGPWAETEFIKRFSGVQTKKVTFEGKEYLRSTNTTYAKTSDCLCLADERTLLGGPEPVLKKMLSAHKAKSPLLDRLPKVDFDHDLVAAFVMEQAERKDSNGPTVRQAFGEILKQNKGPLSANFEGADKIAEELAAATLTIDLGGDKLLSIDLEATDDKSAEALLGLANSGFDVLKVLAPEGKKWAKENLQDGADPTVALIDELVKGFTIQKDGVHVQLTLKMPSQLPTVVEKLTPIVKNMAAPPPNTKPPTPKPPTAKEKGISKDGKKK
jgi:hypothetical protein